MPEAVNLATILGDDDVLLESPVESKMALFTAAAAHLGRSTGIASDDILKALVDREKLGSTAINRGIAVPHAGIDGLAAPAGVVFRLAQPIGFEASDNNPVDLVFALIWPSDKRSGLLATLGGLCRALRAETLPQNIRTATNSAEIRKALDEAAANPTPRPSES
ncbi:MAG TPA: PTS sugar transporter subunit IIA [Hyphomicrobiaceae bacterium]|nr:PTS sugar transporter subunit IIA [Hyphomicrobiaceae bacterium]